MMLFNFAYNEHRYKDALNLAQQLVEHKGSFVWHIKTCQLLFELGYIESAGKMSKQIRLNFPYDIARNDLLQLDLIRLYYFLQIGDYESIEERIEPVNIYASSIHDKNDQVIWSKAVYYNLRGNLLAEEGEYEAAENCFMKSIEYKERLKLHEFIAATLNDLGLTYIKQGNLSSAIKTLKDAEQRLTDIEDFGMQLRRIHGNLGIAHKFFNNIEIAEKYLEEARKPAAEDKDIYFFSFSYHLTRLYQETDRFDKAVQIYNEINVAKDKLNRAEAINLFMQSIYYQLYGERVLEK